MALQTVFLNKNFEFSDDLIKYLNIFDLTVSAHSELYDYFVKRLSEKTVYIDDMMPQFKKQAEKYIVLLCENGIYTKSVEEYVQQSKGYTAVSDTIDSAVAKFFNILSDEIDEYTRGLSNAQAQAESKVTGSGVSVWSSSFTTLAAFATADYLTAKGQLKKAQSEFQTQLSKVETDSHNRSEQRKAQYIRDVYLPNMFNALSIFVSSMMDNCLADLSTAEAFDLSVLEYIDMKKSGELLKNLSLSNDAESVLLAAYAACPFNIQVYVECATRALFTKDMLLFLISINKKEEFETEIKKLYAKILGRVRECSTENFVALLQESKALTEVLSLINTKPVGLYYKNFGSTIYQKIVDQYDTLKNYIKDEKARLLWFEKFAEGDIISMTAEQVENLVRTEVYSISTNDVFSVLINICEYSSLLDEISYSDIPKAEISKSNIDQYYTERCSELIASCLPVIKQSVLDKKAAREQVAEKNIAIKETGEKKKKIFKPLIIVALIIIYLIPITVHFVQASLYESYVKEEITDIINQNLRSKLSDSESTASEIYLQNKYTINSIEFYKSKYDSDIRYIVANVTLYSNTKDTWEVTGRLALNEIVDGTSYVNAPMGIPAKRPFISGNGIIIESDGNQLKASWFDNYNDHGIYEKTNIYISGSWIIGYIFFALVLFVFYKIAYKKLCKKIDKEVSDLCSKNKRNII